MKNKIYQNKGITLIALVITIIVLLILAVISILALLGDNGIITKATKSKESTEVGTEGENVRLAVNAALTVGTGKLNTANLQEAFDNQFGDGARNNLSGDGPWEYTGKYKVYQIDVTGSFRETEIIADDIVFDVPNDYKYEFVAGDDVKVYLVEYEDTQVGKLDTKDLGEVASAATLDAKNLELADIDDDTTYYEMYFIGTGEIWKSSSWYITDGENKTYPCGSNVESIRVNENLLKVISVKISNGITNSGNFGESSLKYIYIPSSVVSIDNEAFFGCTSLTSITIPEGVTKIGSSAFNGCSNLTSITIPESVTIISSSAFADCKNLESIIIPESMISIEYAAFSNCRNLTSITIPKSVRSMGDSVFYGCENLSSIKVDSGNEIYDSREDCNAIIKTSTNKLILGCKNTIIPKSVTSIGNGAFEYCTSLTSITIPDSVTSIGERAFHNCTNLSKVYFEETTPPTFGANCFWKYSGKVSYFYFKNSTVYDSLTTSYYNSSYGEKSTDYSW